MPGLSDHPPTRPNAQNLGKTSFLSQVNSCNSVKNDAAIKTKEEFAIETNQMNNRFIFGLIMFSIVSLGLGVKWLISSQKSLSPECAYCKLSFLSGFYLFALVNVTLIFLYFRNLNSHSEKIKYRSSNLLGNSRAVMILYSTETILFVGLFLGESFLCSPQVGSILLNTFILALVQSTLQLLLNCICSMRLTRFFEQSQEIEAKKKTNQVVEIFNASFCLNETQSEINLYPRRSLYSKEKMKNHSLNRTNNLGNSIYMPGTNLSNIHSISTDITKLGSMLSGDSIMDFQRKKMKMASSSGHRRKFNHVKDFDIYMPDRMELH